MAKLTRKALYEKVWSTPMSRLSEEFGVSDVALGKVCRKHGIPRPGRGYWAKVAAGAKLRRAPLPKRKDDEMVEFADGRGPRQPVPVVELPSVELNRSAELGPGAVWLRTEFRTASEDKYGRVEVPLAIGAVAAVRRHLIDRVVVIMGALEHTWAERGVEIRLGSSRYAQREMMHIVAGGEELRISIEERLDKVRLEPPPEKPRRSLGSKRADEILATLTRRQLRKYDYVPTGQLVLRLLYPPREYEGPTRWRDLKMRTLEEQLGAAVLAFEQAGAVAKAERDAEEVRTQQRLADERVRLRSQRLREYRQRIGVELVEHVGRWKQAEDLRAFLQRYDERLPVQARAPEDERWYRSALRYAELLDPLNEPKALTRAVEPSDEELEVLLQHLRPAQKR